LWLRRRGVEGMAFVARQAEMVSEPEADAFRSGLSPLVRLKIKALCVRHELLGRFDTFERDTMRRSVLAAISLGDKTMLDKSLKSRFADAGVSHVLALSGLHLGIIMMFLLFVFRPLRMFDFAQWALPLVSVVFLWLFVLLTGCGVSVVRSAFMLSCVLLLGMRGDGFSSINNVVLAALVILLFSPPSLFDISFLLSFLTVGMLVFLMPYYRESSWRLSWGRFAFVADFVYVSVVAWAVSAPLVACVFGRVSLYFLLGNVVAVPCAWLILVGSLCFLLLSWLPGVADLSAMLVDGSLAVLLGATDFIASLPAASVEVSLGLAACFALYMVIASVVCLVLSHTRVNLYLLILSVGLFLSFLLWGV
ncbi:MAG: ComEC/Rec2 family competence protein, partial [Bacteroidaceae bacterium]